MLTISKIVEWLKEGPGLPEGVDPDEEDPKEFPYIEDGFKKNVHVFRTYIKVFI